MKKNIFTTILFFGAVCLAILLEGIVCTSALAVSVSDPFFQKQKEGVRVPIQGIGLPDWTLGTGWRTRQYGCTGYNTPWAWCIDNHVGDLQYLQINGVSHSKDGTGTLTPNPQVAAVVGHTYTLVYTLYDVTSGGVIVSFGGVSAPTRTSDGSYSDTIVAVSTAGLVVSPSVSTARFTIQELNIDECLSACTRSGTTWTCPDVSYSCVNAVQSDPSYQYGDTIYLSGTTNATASWTRPLILKKGTWLKGAGRDTITIKYGGYEGDGIQLTPDSWTRDPSHNLYMKVSGITVDGNDGFPSARAISLNAPAASPFKRFMVFGNRMKDIAAAVSGYNAAYGVVYDNIIDNVHVPSRNMATGGGKTMWDTLVSIDWPTDNENWLYFEDNYETHHVSSKWPGGFDLNVAFHYSGQGGKGAYVRYNTIDMQHVYKGSETDNSICQSYYGTNAPCWPFMLGLFETHDSRPLAAPSNSCGYAGTWGPLGSVFYANKIINDDIDWYGRNRNFFISRGGKSIIGWNKWYFTDRVDVHGFNGFMIWNYFGDCLSDPYGPISAEEKQYTHDTYFFNNRYGAGTLSTGDAGQASVDACLGKSGVIVNYGACVHSDPPYSYIIRRTATGGSISTLEDSIFDFVAGNIHAGMWVVNETTGGGVTAGCEIATVATHTLTCVGTVSRANTSGDTYYVVNGNAGLNANVDWWSDASAVGDAQTTGIGCGTLGNRPKNCTTGVAYFATDNNCSQVLDANTGQNASSSVSGTLYKCTAPNTWTAYWTPYTYPHPLRGIIDVTAPAAPSGLSIQ